MASLSLPRVLQLKKNSLDAEREQFEKFQSQSISKAINGQETPVKEKHVRSTIIGSFQEQGAVTYWVVAVRLPLQDNRIVAWKFCQVTHKLLREGHPACLVDSQRHIIMIENLGKLWVHLREGYGKLVHLYCGLLVCKLQFHARNPRFPGNMQLTASELDEYAENDVNNYFQLCVELFDYMDEILNLQMAVFDSLGNARSNSMTASGQCRLAALIPCAQDSSHIYDCNVRLLFRLHAALPADTLAGHRERFRVQFKKLSGFYKQASTMQYYRNLLTLPQLPSNPPNFLIQSDFGTYVAPVVTIPEPALDETDSVGALIDTSDTMSQMSQALSVENLEVMDSRTTPSPQPDLVVERDRLIEHLQSELKRLRSEVVQLEQDRHSMVGSMREHCARLDAQLFATRAELEEEKQKAVTLTAQAPEITQKMTEAEEKAKVTDEKFQKLKSAYTQLREEHIALIRQKAEVDKAAASLRTAAAEQESTKMQLQQQLNDRSKDVELLQQSASNSESTANELETLRTEISSLQSALAQSKVKESELETLRESFNALEVQHKSIETESQERLADTRKELEELKGSLEQVKQEKEVRDSELVRLKEEIVGLREKSGEEYNRVVEEREAAVQQVTALTEQHRQEKQDLLQHNTGLEKNLDTVKKQLEETQKELENQRSQVVTSAAQGALELIAAALANLERGSAQESNQAAAELAVQAFAEMAARTEVKGHENVVARSAISAAHNTVQLVSHASTVASTATDLELVDKLTGECRTVLQSTQQCMEALSRGAVDAAVPGAARGQVKTLLAATEAADRLNSGVRSVDDELADMDKAIEDAAGRIEEMLAASRAGDSGVKLEVNSKILDACTTLMAAVKILVQDARKLQNELGDPTTRQKMYRRNPQWSQGLISAAKSVVFAAKLLVSSADEAVVGRGPVEGVSAASHEVAGSTAQLVAASRARAPPASPALAQLTQASRSVAAATGAVVAAVRAAASLVTDQEVLDTSALTLTATRRLEMESKVRSLELESALDAERARLAALRRRHYQLAQAEENGSITNGQH